MRILEAEATSTTPYVRLDSQTGELVLRGISMPENVADFYRDKVEWIRSYVVHPASETRLLLDFEYFNSATSKIFMELISILERLLDEGKPVRIEWYSDPRDLDMREAGEDYAMLTRIPVQFFDRG